MVLDVVIVGGGLSGLCVAHGLHLNKCKHWKLLEAHPQRLGGRLVNANQDTEIDMGGAWVWLDNQPAIKSLIKQLNLETFPQPDDVSSTRFVGGAVQLIKALEQRIQSRGVEADDKDKKIELNSTVVSCHQVDQKDKTRHESLLEITTTDGTTYLTHAIVWALPPKLLWKTVQFDPPLSVSKQQAMERSFTWMAGVTKVALVYSHRFWDLNGSNLALDMRQGPAFQVYDSSTQHDEIHALTFFAHVHGREGFVNDDDLLAKAVAAQMAHTWKDHPSAPRDINQVFQYTSFYVYRWPHNPLVSDEREPLRIHPHPQPVAELAALDWQGRLLFCGTESDSRSPGVMEGAVRSANRVLSELLPRLEKKKADE